MEDIFVRKNEAPKPSFNIGVILQKKPTKGTVGLEIEIEGKRLPMYDHVTLPWVYHEDGSLRGQENGEYVLAKPIEFHEVEKALDHLWGIFKERKSVIDESNRTSVHVHLNCQSFHFNRLASFAALYFTFEEVLTEWCGETRVGNMFCLMAKDAPYIVSTAKNFIKHDGEYPINQKLHYGGLNIHALNKYGSIEIRTLRGCSDPKVILDWVKILQRLYELSGDFSDPREICAMFSANGPLMFFESILGDRADIVRNGIEMDNDRIVESMYEGIRIAQDLCFCRDWSLILPQEIKADPFGRAINKVAKKIMGYSPNATINSVGTALDNISLAIQSQEMPDFDDMMEAEPDWEPPEIETDISW